MTKKNKELKYHINRKIYQYSKDGEFIAEFENVSTAKKFICEEYNLKKADNIYSCLTGYNAVAYGFIWSYEKKDKINPYKPKRGDNKKTYLYDLEGNFIKEFKSKHAALIFLYGKKNGGNIDFKHENQLYLKLYRARSEKFEKIEPYQCKISHYQVFQYDLDGKFIKKFSSLAEATRSLNLIASNCIKECIKGERISYKGYQWKSYKKDYIEPVRFTEEKKYFQYDLYGNFLKEWTYEEVIEEYKTAVGINRCLKGEKKSHLGFLWKDFKTNKIEPYKRVSIDRPIIIYYYKNKITGQFYIGQTLKESLSRRAGKDGSDYKNCTKFYNAILFYGWDNFEGKIITKCNSVEEADYIEDQLINKYDTIRKGYNSRGGGRLTLCSKLNPKKITTDFVLE